MFTLMTAKILYQILLRGLLGSLTHILHRLRADFRMRQLLNYASLNRDWLNVQAIIVNCRTEEVFINPE